MKYLLDTNICIYIIKRKPAIVFEKLRELPLGDVAISTISLAELAYGIRKSINPEKNLEALKPILNPA